MKMNLRPMMFLAQNCTECNRVLPKPEEAASSEDIADVYEACTGKGLAEQGLEFKICSKCGRRYYEKRDET